MNSQTQNPSGGSTGGRSSAGDPPSPPDETARGQSLGASGQSNRAGSGLQGKIRSSGSKPGGGGPLSGSPDADIPVITPTFGASRPGRSGNATGSPYPAAEPGGAQSFGSSGRSESRAGGSSGSDHPTHSTGPSKPAPTGTEALVAEAEDTLGKASDSVHAATSAARDATVQIADVAKEALSATVSAVAAQASALTSNITDELAQTAEAQKERGAAAMHRFAKAVRIAADELGDGSPEIARQVRAAAGSVDSLSDNLHGKSIGDLFTAASDFARRQPATFFAGAVIAGFALSRFLKSSNQPVATAAGGSEEGKGDMAAPMPPVAGADTGSLRPSAPSASSF